MKLIPTLNSALLTPAIARPFTAISTQVGRLPAGTLAVSLVVVLLFASVSAFAADRVYYRYVNDEGIKVLNAVLPPEFAKNGYEVVTLNGKVIETVAPALTGEQKEEAAARRKREAELAEWDKSLLRRYSSVADIEQAKLRKMHDFDANISILRANQNNFNRQIEQAQAKAADAERAGRQVPQPILDQISSLETKLEDTLDQIQKREAEKQKTSEEYDLDVERFREIKPRS